LAQLLAPPTRSGLLAEARHAVLPLGIVSSGFPAVEATCRRIGLFFDPWQADLNRCILAKGSDGLYAADTVVISIPRQVGKTWDVGALVFADCIINPGTTVVWTAHRFKVARETFNELKGIAQSAALAPHIDPEAITTAAGNESIPFRNGSRIVFAARERGAIRGFTKVRRLILDEGQILTDAALADLAPTMNQAKNPQIIIMGTPPKPTDPGEVFTRLRTEALSGESEGVLYVEFSAAPDAEPDDESELRTANPSYPRRTSRKAIDRLRRLLSAEDYLREVFGVWDDLTGARVFGPGRWDACRVPMPSGLPLLGLAVAVSYDLSKGAIVGAALDGDRVHVKPLQHGPGTGWIAERAKVLQQKHNVAVGIDPFGPASDLVPSLEHAGVHLRQFKTPEVLDSCAAIYKRAQDGTLGHDDYPELNDAVAAAVKRAVGDRWAWGRKQSTADISTLEAATLAAWMAGQPTITSSAYEDRELMVL